MRGGFPCHAHLWTNHGKSFILIPGFTPPLTPNLLYLLRYGFDYGSIHFVLMSTEHAFDPTSVQYKFLDSHMGEVKRSVTPWLVFIGHRPMYVDCVKENNTDSNFIVSKVLRQQLEPLLLVSLVHSSTVS